MHTLKVGIFKDIVDHKMVWESQLRIYKSSRIHIGHVNGPSGLDVVCSAAFIETPLLSLSYLTTNRDSDTNTTSALLYHVTKYTVVSRVYSPPSFSQRSVAA